MAGVSVASVSNVINGNFGKEGIGKNVLLFFGKSILPTLVCAVIAQTG